MGLNEIEDLLMLVIGIAVVAFAIVRAKKLGGAPFEVSGKFGSLRADRVALLVLVGVAFSSVGVFFRVRGYEQRLADLTSSDASINARYEGLQLQLDRMKDYDLTVALDFHEPVDLDQLKVSTWVREPGASDSAESKQPLDAKVASYAGNVVILRLSKLKKGDHLTIKGDLKGNVGVRHWESIEIEVPTFNFDMQEKSKP